MKITLFICLIFSLNSASLGYVYNPQDLAQKLESKTRLLEERQNDPHFLFINKREISKELKTLKICVEKEKTYLTDQKKELQLLKKINHEAIGANFLNQKNADYKQHQNTLYLCEYLIVKVNKIINKIETYNNNSFLNDFFYKDKSFLEVINKFWSFRWPSPQIFFSLLMEQANFQRYFLVIFTASGFLLLIHFLNKRKSSLLILNRIDQKKLLLTIAMYAITSPILYLVSYIIYFQKNDLLNNFFTGNFAYIGAYIYVYSLYRYLKIQSYKKDILMIIPIFLLIIFVLLCSIDLLYLKQLSFNLDRILSIKYLIFLALQPVQISILYWIFLRILPFNFINKKAKIGCAFLLMTNLFMGLNGYQNFAANINFLIIIDSLLVGVIIVFSNLFFITQTDLMNDETNSYKLIKKYFTSQAPKAFFSISLIFTTLYLIFIFEISVAISIISIPVFTESQLTKIYQFIYGQRLFFSIEYSIQKLFQAFVLFNFLTLINYLVSAHFARKIYQEESSQQKTVNIFISIGYLLSIFVIIFLLNIHIENIGIISGAIFLGIGVALQSSLSKIFSSFLLYINPPFRVGDYIEIQNTKGYVKKISFLETFIETNDNNTIILPNQFINSSIIKNYNFENKYYQKVHINFTMSNLDIDKEEEVKNKLREILNHDKHVVENANHPISFIFSIFSQTTDTHHLEITFSYLVDTNPKLELAQLNREIANLLKTFNIDAKFESMHFPYE